MKTHFIAFTLLFVPLLALGNSENTRVMAETATESASLGDAQELVLQALALSGVTYRYGGTSIEAGFDCSGFVQHVFRQATGGALPRNALAMSRAGREIAQPNLRPGDLVFFNTLRRAFSHVGIYIGDNRFIHAPSTGRAIKISSLEHRYWSTRFNGARRVLEDVALAKPFGSGGD